MHTVTVLGNPKLLLVGILSVDESSLSTKVSTRPCVAGSSLGQSHLSESTAESGVKTAKMSITVPIPANDFIAGSSPLSLIGNLTKKERWIMYSVRMNLGVAKIV